MAREVATSFASDASGEGEAGSDSSQLSKTRDSAPAEFWTEQAPWQILLSKHGLNNVTMDLLGRANLRSTADWV